MSFLNLLEDEDQHGNSWPVFVIDCGSDSIPAVSCHLKLGVEIGMTAPVLARVFFRVVPHLLHSLHSLLSRTKTLQFPSLLIMTLLDLPLEIRLNILRHVTGPAIIDGCASPLNDVGCRRLEYSDFGDPRINLHLTCQQIHEELKFIPNSVTLSCCSLLCTRRVLSSFGPHLMDRIKSIVLGSMYSMFVGYFEPDSNEFKRGLMAYYKNNLDTFLNWGDDIRLRVITDEVCPKVLVDREAK